MTVAARQLTTAAEVAQNAAAVLARRDQQRKVQSTSQAVEALLQHTIRDLKSENQHLKERVRAMELQISDYQARILDQASQICAMQGIEKTKVVRKRAIGDIVADVLKDFPGIEWEDIISVRRTRALVHPRHLCMAAVHEQRPDLSLPAIGRIFGGRDHTTVLHAVKKVEAQRAEA